MKQNLPRAKKAQLEELRASLLESMDRLFFAACLATLKKADVYNPGARSRIPDLYTIDAYLDVDLGSLPVGESFRVSADPSELYEILAKLPFPRREVVARNVEGFVTTMDRKTKVKVQSNLTRSPDGNAESKVALTSFPVGHYVNYRSMRLADQEKGYVFVFAGDGQATPHFMRYSGLTGAAINVMAFNIFLKGATEGVPFLERFKN